MGTAIADDVRSTTVDLTGLPVSVIQRIRQMVEHLRAQQPSELPNSGQSLIGLFAHFGIPMTQEFIDRCQAEIWSNMPRDVDPPVNS